MPRGVARPEGKLLAPTPVEALEEESCSSRVVGEGGTQVLYLPPDGGTSK